MEQSNVKNIVYKYEDENLAHNRTFQTDLSYLLRAIAVEIFGIHAINTNE